MSYTYDPLSDYRQYAESEANVPSALGSATDAMQSGMYSGLEFATREVGLEGVSDWAKQQATENLALSQQYVPKGPTRIEDVDFGTNFLDYAGNIAVQQAPILGTMVGAGVAGGLVAGPMGALAAATAVTAPMHLGEAYTRQKEMGVDDPSAVWGATAINTALDVIPVGTAINTARKLGGGTLAKAFAKGAVAEGTTEAVQGGVVDYAAGIKPSFEEEYVMDRVNEAVAGAGMGGAVTSAGPAVGSVARLPGKVYDTVRSADFDPMQGIKDTVGYQDSPKSSPFRSRGADTAEPHKQETGPREAGLSADLEINAIRNQLVREGFIYPEQSEYLGRNYTPEQIDLILDVGQVVEQEEESIAQAYDEAAAQEDVDPYLEPISEEQQFKERVTEAGDVEAPEAQIGKDVSFSTRNLRIGKRDAGGKKWEEDDYLLNVDKAKEYKGKTRAAEFEASDKLVSELDESSKRDYRKTTLIEGIEADVRRDMSRATKADPSPEELKTKVSIPDNQGKLFEIEVNDPTTAKSILELTKAKQTDYNRINELLVKDRDKVQGGTYESRLAQRKEDVAADIMETRSNKEGGLYKELTKRYAGGKNPDAVLDLYDAIEVRDIDKALRPSENTFDYEDRQKVERAHKKSTDVKKDTTQISKGFITVIPEREGAPYRQLDMIKAVKLRKKQIKEQGNYEYIEDKDIEGFDKGTYRGEDAGLTAEAVKSVIGEYLPRIDMSNEALSAERKARTDVTPRMSESPKLQAIYNALNRIDKGDTTVIDIPVKDINTGKSSIIDATYEIAKAKGNVVDAAKNLFHKVNFNTLYKNKKYQTLIADTEAESDAIVNLAKTENLLAEVGVSAKFMPSIYEDKLDYQVMPGAEVLGLTGGEKAKAKKESTNIQLARLDTKLEAITKSKKKNPNLRDWEQLTWVGKDKEGKAVYRRDHTRLISDEDYKNPEALVKQKELFKDDPKLPQELKDRADWEVKKKYRDEVNRKAKRLEAQLRKKEKELGVDKKAIREIEVMESERQKVESVRDEYSDKGEFDYREDYEDVQGSAGQEGGYQPINVETKKESRFVEKKTPIDFRPAAEQMAGLVDKKGIKRPRAAEKEAEKAVEKEAEKAVEKEAKRVVEKETERVVEKEAKRVVEKEAAKPLFYNYNMAQLGVETQKFSKGMRLAIKAKDQVRINELQIINRAIIARKQVIREENKIKREGKSVGMAKAQVKAKAKVEPEVTIASGVKPWEQHITDNNLKTTLASIINSRDELFGKDTALTYIARRILKQVDNDTKIYTIDNVPKQVIKDGFKLKKDQLGVYNPVNDMVVIHKDAGALGTQVIIHEAIHAATYNALESYKQGKPVNKRVKDLGDEITSIQNTMKQYFEANPDKMSFYSKYSTYDVHEFMAVALTDFNVMKVMRAIPYKRKTLLNRFSDSIRKFIGIKASEQNVLNAMLDISGEVFTEAGNLKEIDAKYGGLSYKVETPLNIGMAQSPMFLFQKYKLEIQEVKDELEKKIVKTKARSTVLHVQLKRAENKLRALVKENPELKEESFIPKPGLSTAKRSTKKGAKPGKEAKASDKMSTAQTQALANKLLHRIKTNARIIDGTAALKMAKKLKIEEPELGMKLGSLHGFADPKPNMDGSYNVYINPLIQGKLREEILQHELGHIIQYDAFNNASESESQGVIKEYMKWLNTMGRDTVLLEDIIKSKKAKESIAEYMYQFGPGYKLRDVAENMRGYMLNFDEWFADQAGKALARNTAPRTIVQKFFDKIIKSFKKLFGTEDQVEKYIDRLRDKSYVGSGINNRLAAEAGLSRSFVSGLEKHSKFKAAKESFTNILLDKDYNLRHLADGKIDAFNDLADLMFKSRGSTKTDNSYWHNKLLYLAKYDTRATDIMRGATDEVQRKVMRELYNENLADRYVNFRTLKLRELFRDLKQYMEAEGIKVPTRKNYFPNMANPEYVEEHHDDFIEMMNRYPDEMDGIANKWNRDTRDQAEYMTKTVNKDDLVTSADIPQMLFDNIVRGDLMDEASSEGQQTPHVRFLKHRVIDFLEGVDKADWKNNYLQHSVTDATSTYIMQVVKRVEYTKRFGKLNVSERQKFVAKKKQDGGQSSYTEEDIRDFESESRWTNRLEVLLDRAMEEGATDAELQKARNYVAAEMGTHGRDTATWLNKHLGIPMPQSHAPINTTLQKGTSTLMAFANVWVLGMSTITSLLDPVGIAVRSGSVTQMVKSMANGLSVAVGKDRHELEVLAEAVGSISDVATKEALAHGYNMINMTPAVRKMNDKFFKAIGLEQWTRTTRLMAVDAAQGFIKRHDSNPNKHSFRFLKELGLQGGDVKYGKNGKVKVLTYEEYQEASVADQKSDDRLKSAIAEFVDTSILRPSPSQRPAWASDPHFALLFHLKSFMYSFQKTILSPLWQEAKQGNYAPLLAVSMYVPAGIAVGIIKDMVKTMGDDDDDWTPTYKENWGLGDYMLDGAEKSGMTGLLQPIFDVQRSQQYGGTWIGGLFGPTLEPWDTFNGLPVPFNYLYANLEE